MISITRSTWIVCLLICSATAFAQAQPGEEAVPDPAATDTPAPCVTPGEGQAADGEIVEKGAEAVPCEEVLPEALAADVVEDAFADTQDEVLETTGDSVTAQEEIESGEEISEDYPVPLPSDI